MFPLEAVISGSPSLCTQATWLKLGVGIGVTAPMSQKGIAQSGSRMNHRHQATG